MLIGIIAAMDEEIKYIKNILNDKSEKNIANIQLIKGTFHRHKVIILKSGIGKVNAAMATTILMENYKPDYVINTGTAGGISTDIEVGNVIIAEEVVHHDVDVTAFDYELGQVPQLPPTFKADTYLLNQVKTSLNKLTIQNKAGIVATADSFMDSDKKIENLKENFPKVVAVEMEGAAIAQVCYHYKVPFTLIRAISDIAGEESPMSFHKFINLAAKNTADMIEHLLSD